MGVAYNDNAGTGFYQPGEGQGGVQIDAVNLQTGAVSSTQTWDSGGYELALAPGQYRSSRASTIRSSRPTITSRSRPERRARLLLTNSWQGGTRESAIAAAQPSAAPVVSLAAVAAPMVTQPVVAPPVVSVPLVSTPVVTVPVVTVPVVTQPTSTPTSVMSMLSNNWSAWHAPVI